MAGNKAGGLKAAATNKKLHGDDFYARIGAKGGRNGHTGGFGCPNVGVDCLTGRERASIVGAKGGRISKRDEAKTWYGKNKHKIEYMRQDGFTIKEIGSVLGCSQQKLYYVIEKYGDK